MECKVVVVGDSKCGKTALVQRFANDNFSTIYTPTDFERCSVEHLVGDYNVQLTLWDTSGASAYDTVRPLCYKDSRAFLLCFDISSQVSLHNALKKWYPEIRTHSEAPIVLCGCQSDSRDDVKHPVTPEQIPANLRIINVSSFTDIMLYWAAAVSRQMNASAYVETSSKDELGVTDVFELAALAGLGKSRFSSLVRRHAPHLKRHVRLSQQHKSCLIM